jgi:hypothetical protein
MAIEEITNYTCVWDIDDHKGYIGLFSGEEFQIGHEYENPMEFMAVLSILRNETPLYFDNENHWLSAGVKLTKELFTVDE